MYDFYDKGLFSGILSHNLFSQLNSFNKKSTEKPATGKVGIEKKVPVQNNIDYRDWYRYWVKVRQCVCHLYEGIILSLERDKENCTLGSVSDK